MRTQLVIQVVLIVAVAAMGWMMLRSPGGARHLAARRLVTLAFVLFAIVAIITPSLVTGLAHLMGVGRGADLLLYALVIAFLASLLSSFRRNAAMERRLTRLARRVALDEAPGPDERHATSTGEDATGATTSPSRTEEH
ncbi:DUF2304 domain-containing protein [Actinomyces radicidentis]|uniref:DUF2304 domain-containing protein n=1 Tax=Actinomyces radicidentis TaxID=111015 RepID=UPI0028E22178|nr:DUF2304 domain-containing protein [Actinomyces radicidentis]